MTMLHASFWLFNLHYGSPSSLKTCSYLSNYMCLHDKTFKRTFTINVNDSRRCDYVEYPKVDNCTRLKSSDVPPLEIID